jgi:hypothetical protein
LFYKTLEPALSYKNHGHPRVKGRVQQICVPENGATGCFKENMSYFVRKFLMFNYIDETKKKLYLNYNGYGEKRESSYIFVDYQIHIKAVPWLRRLVAGLSPRRPGFDRGSVHVGFVVEKVALGQVSTRELRFSFANFIPPVLHYTEKRRD